MKLAADACIAVWKGSYCAKLSRPAIEAWC